MLQKFLRKNWVQFFGSPCPSRLQVATITSCLHDYGNDLVLIFTDDGSAPRYVMKICRAAEYGFKLEREFAALRDIAEDERLRQVTPAAHHLGVFAERTFFIEEGIQGTSLSRLIRERGLNRTNRKLLENAVDLLVDLNSHAARGAPVSEMDDDTALNLSAHEKKLLADRVSELSGGASRYYLHGDFWPLNLLIRDDHIVGIVDWEFSVPVSSLPSDIVWFLVNLGYVLGHAKFGDVSLETSYRWAFFQPGKCGEFLEYLRRRYFGAMGLEDQIFLPLLEVSLSQMARRELLAYGQHGKMDTACMEILRHTLGHEKDLCVG
jgi:hypothetical protein